MPYKDELTSEEFSLINNMIDDIYNDEDLRSLRAGFLHSLRKLVKCQLLDFNLGMITLDGVPKLVDPVTISDFPKSVEEEFMSLYDSTFYKMDYVSWIFQDSESIVYKESDLVSSQVRKRSPFYNDYLLKFGVTTIAGISIAHNNTFLGAVALYRNESQPDFDDKDLYILELLTPHLERRLDKETTIFQNKHKNDSVFLKYHYGITHREIEIMGYLLYGYSNEDISGELEISVNTVKTHIKSIFSKIGVNSRTQMTKFILKRNLIYIWDSNLY